MKKLIMFFMVLMLCLGFVGEAKAVPDCVTICPAGGPDDEITFAVYDEEGEFVDLSELDYGVEISFWDPDGYFYIEAGDPEMVDGSVVIVLGEALYDAIYAAISVDGAYFNLGYDKEGPGTFESFSDAVDAGGTCPEEIPVCPETSSPIKIDPNESMVVYETNETESGFGVSLKNQPPAGVTITVTVDPNADGDGANEDIKLIDGSGPGNIVTFSFTDSNWDVPQMVIFGAINDLIDDAFPGQPNLIEQIEIFISSSWPAHPTDANFVGEKTVTVQVVDNDQANILFTITPAEKNNPKNPILLGQAVQLWEQERLNFYTKWRKIGVTLQVPPLGGDVRISVANESDYPPIMDPPLTTTGDPNALIFDDTTWNVSQNIQIWANDDDELQAEGAEAEGDENYQAEIVFTVVDDGGDDRYADMVQTVNIDIEDNECGAYGISYLDIANSNGEDESDCYVDIYDVIEFATKWLDCSDPQDVGCESYL